MKEPKLKKLSRKELIEQALQDLQTETGFHFTHIRFGNGYLVDNTRNGVCWFDVKELPGYRFALWHRDMYTPKGFGPEYENSELILFTQHLLTLDKFKPSRSSFRTPMHRYLEKPNGTNEWQEVWYDYGAINIMKFIHNHKYKAFYIQSYSDWDPWDNVSSLVAFKEYYRIRFNSWMKEKKEKAKIKRISKDLIRKVKNVDGIRVVISDYGDLCYPRLHMFMYENKKAKRDVELIDDIIEYIDDKYWNDVSFFMIENSDKFKSIVKNREKQNGKDETLIYTKM